MVTDSGNASQAEQGEDRRTGTVEIQAEVVWRECRRRGWSVEKLAGEAGLHRATLDRLPESGPVRVHLTTMTKIGQAFRKNAVDPILDELLTGGQNDR